MSDEEGDNSRKLKRKIDDHESYFTDVADSEVLLSLSLGNSKKVGESSSPSMFMSKTLKTHNSDSACFASKPMEKYTNYKQLIISKQCQFSCKFCNKKFPTCQALGGHQNAHRRERLVSRIDKEFDMTGFGVVGVNNMMRPYPTIMAQYHQHYYPFRPFYYGANMHPMSTMPWPFSAAVLGHANHNTSSMLEQQFGVTNNARRVAVEHNNNQLQYSLDAINGPTMPPPNFNALLLRRNQYTQN